MNLTRLKLRSRQRWFVAIATSALLAGNLVFTSTALGLSQSEFELDKNAEDGVATAWIAILNSNVNATAGSIVVCRFGATDPTANDVLQIDAEQMTYVSSASANGGGCPATTVVNGVSVPTTKRTWTVTRHA